MKNLMLRTVLVGGTAISSFLIASTVHSASNAVGVAAAPHHSATTTQAIPPAARTTPTMGISKATLGAMRNQGVSIDPVPASTTPTKLTADNALTLAAGSFGFVNDGKATGIELAQMTDSQYGKELEPDPSKPSRIDPTIHNKLVWLIEFHGFTPWMSSPARDAREGPPETTPLPEANGRMLVAVDPSTGQVIWGQQF